MAVTLYTSRIVLEKLGVEDFGIYNIVGGIVAVFSFLNSTLSGATSRFLSIEIGKNDGIQLNKVFNSSILLHFLLSIIIIVLAETIGLWFVSHKLVIPEGRLHAALIVYQFSIFASVFSILRIPYTASIISHEHMKAYAYIGIMDSLAKLIIVFLLSIILVDKLILYGILIFAVTLVITLCYIIYCMKNFISCNVQLNVIDKKTILPILYFSSLDLYGNMSIMIRNQGVNIIQNLFFGPLVNAATAIAMQVQNAVNSFSDSFLLAVKPRIFKSFAISDIKEMQSLIYLASKFSFFLLLLPVLPLIIDNKFILSLWLKNTPEYASIFTQISLLLILFSALFNPVLYAIHATGKMKKISFITGTIFITTLPLSYIFLRMGFSPVVPFIINFIIQLLCSFVNLYILQSYISDFSPMYFLRTIFFKCVLIFLLSSIIPIYIYMNLDFSWIRFLLVFLSSVIMTLISVYFLGLNKKERSYLIKLIKDKIIK